MENNDILINNLDYTHYTKTRVNINWNKLYDKLLLTKHHTFVHC